MMKKAGGRALSPQISPGQGEGADCLGFYPRPGPWLPAYSKYSCTDLTSMVRLLMVAMARAMDSAPAVVVV